MKLPRDELAHFLAHHLPRAKHALGPAAIAPPRPTELPAPRDAHPFAAASPRDEARLVRAIAQHRGVPDDHVLVTAGGTEALFLAAFCLVSAGDGVLVDAPAGPSLSLASEALGARIERVTRRMERDWRLDVDALLARLDADTRLVVLANPNPVTGRLTTAADLLRLARACEQVDAWLLVDEGNRCVVQPRPPVGHTLHPRILTAESLGPAHGLNGLQVGWLLAPPVLQAQLRAARAVTTAGPATLSQDYALEALRHEETLLNRALQISHANLARWRRFAKRHPQLAWREPDSPLATLVRLPEGVDDAKACELLLHEEGVLLVPGTCLGMPGHVGLGFGSEPEQFEQGLEAWGRHMASHGY